MSTFKYPLNVDSSSASTLPSDAMARGATTDFLVIYVLNTSDPKEGFNPFQSFGKQGAAGGFSKEGSITDTIYLHMPNQIQANYQISYKDASLGAFGAAAASALQPGGEGITAEAIAGAAQSLEPEMKAKLLETAISAANGLTGVSGGPSAGDLAVLTTRKAFNPYKENIFESVPFRQHSFSVKMVPRNAQESEQIRGIINALKFGMHPKFGGAGSGQSIAATRWLDIPYSFGLEYKRIGASSSQLLYKFMPSVLTSLNVDYTPDGNYVAGRNLEDFNESGMAVNLQMTFKETKIITKDVLQSDTGIHY